MVSTPVSSPTVLAGGSMLESASKSCSHASPMVRTVLSFQRAKEKQRKIVSLTCYDYTTARLLDEEGDIDLLLVGDSLAMTVLGHPDTLRVTMDEMLHHVKAVSRGTKHALVLADMPFLSYQVEHTEAIRNAGRFMQEGGAKAVKLEGASAPILRLVEHLTAIGIPVVGHLGFTPQSVHTLGGYKVQGKGVSAARQLIEDALQLQKAGIFALVLEMVPVEVAAFISRLLTIPVIGIGAGQGCDGQVLVIDDLLGRYSEITPRFVRRYMQSAPMIRTAVKAFADDIQTGNFPVDAIEAFPVPESEHVELAALFATFTKSTTHNEKS